MQVPDCIAVDVAAAHIYWTKMSIPTTLWDVVDSFVEAAKALTFLTDVRM